MFWVLKRTSILKAEPGKHDIKRHEPGIFKLLEIPRLLAGKGFLTKNFYSQNNYCLA